MYNEDPVEGKEDKDEQEDVEVDVGAKVESLITAVRFGVQSQVNDFLTENKELANILGTCESAACLGREASPNLPPHPTFPPTHRRARPQCGALGCQEG